MRVPRIGHRLGSVGLSTIIAASAVLAVVKPGAVLATPDLSIPPLLASVGPAGGNSDQNVIWMGSSADASHVVFRTFEALTSDDTNSRLDLYEWSQANGVRLITPGSTTQPTYEGLLLSEDGEHIFISTPDPLLPADTDSDPDVYEWSGGQLTLASTSPTDTGSNFNYPVGVTPDGGTLYFYSSGRLTPDDTDDKVDIYKRTGGVVSLISVSAIAGNGPHHVTFNGMSADGSHVFFQTEEQLDPIDTDTVVDLYAWSAAGIELISTGPTDTGANGAGYQASTADGTHAYFVTDGRMTADDTDLNSDVYERFQGVTRLVSQGAAGEEAGNFVRVQAVSTDGSVTVLEAAGRLIADDTDNQNDLYEIRGTAITLLTPGDDGVGASLLGMTPDGSRIFFSTPAPLVATDTDSSRDIYLHSDGGTELVSTAPGNPNFGIDAEFLGMSTDGGRVFFRSGEPLDAGDVNNDYDIAIWDEGEITRLPLPSGGDHLLEYNGSSGDGTRLFLRLGATMRLVPADTDSGRDIYQFTLPFVTPPPPNPFVTAVGTQLELDGGPFTFTGMNIYNANSDDWCANNMDNGKLETALSDIGLGGVHGGDHGVIRAWFFQPLATVGLTGTRDWTRFDRTLAAAKATGYYVLPTLGNQWGECGHKGATSPYKTLDWYRTGYTQLQPEDSVYATYTSYRDWVAEVVARYKDDPTILAWQLLNEAETDADHPDGCVPGPDAYNALHDWATDVSALIKSIDANHLVSLGTIGSGQCGASGPEYKSLHAIPTIDLCEFHDYNPWDAMPGDVYNGLATRIQQCGQLGKPLFIGEVGLRPVDIGGSYESRVASLRAKIQAQRGAGVVGHLVWNWGPGPRALDAYDIGPGDPVLSLLAAGPPFDNPPTPFDTDWVAPKITLGAPNRSLYTLNEPLTASFACTEVGSAGLATCDGTLASSSPIDTSSTGHFTFTVLTTDNVGNHRTVSQVYDVTAGDVTTTVPQGAPATVTTDPGGVGASAAVPIQTTVEFTAPSGSPTPVSIDLHPPTIGAPSGYAILGNEVDIDLGGLTRPTADPIVITFVVDSSTGADPATITMSRTNADSTTDIALPCDAVPTASPDPCYVAAFVAGVGSDVRVTIYTTHASKWLALRRTDTTPPVIAFTVTGTLGSNGWYRSNVGVAWTKTDAQSAILTSSGCGPTTIATDTAGTTLTCSATSAGGNAMQSATIKRDATLPSLSCVGATFLLGAKGARVSATVTDAMSGPAAAMVFANANTSSVGRKTVQVTGLDRAGNSATASCSYVVGYALTKLKPTPGFVVKRGSTISVQFMLMDSAGRLISDKSARAIVSACAARILFSAGNPSPNCARYDAAAHRFLFDLKTSKTMPPGTFVVTVQISSGADVITSASVAVEIRQ